MHFNFCGGRQEEGPILCNGPGLLQPARKKSKMRVLYMSVGYQNIRGHATGKEGVDPKILLLIFLT